MKYTAHHYTLVQNETICSEIVFWLISHRDNLHDQIQQKKLLQAQFVKDTFSLIYID